MEMAFHTTSGNLRTMDTESFKSEDFLNTVIGPEVLSQYAKARSVGVSRSVAFKAILEHLEVRGGHVETHLIDAAGVNIERVQKSAVIAAQAAEVAAATETEAAAK
jgi:hypothetical protein